MRSTEEVRLLPLCGVEAARMKSRLPLDVEASAARSPRASVGSPSLQGSVARRFGDLKCVCEQALVHKDGQHHLVKLTSSKKKRTTKHAKKAIAEEKAQGKKKGNWWRNLMLASQVPGHCCAGYRARRLDGSVQAGIQTTAWLWYPHLPEGHPKVDPRRSLRQTVVERSHFSQHEAGKRASEGEMVTPHSGRKDGIIHMLFALGGDFSQSGPHDGPISGEDTTGYASAERPEVACGDTKEQD